MINNIKEILLWIWQLPQNLLGLLLLFIYRQDKEYHRRDGRIFYYTPEMPSGISLGNYIILRRADFGDSMNHEFGHSRQSRFLGPLYLIIIGLFSLGGNIYDRIFHKGSKWYYNLPWEKWADRLGGVVRHFA